MCLQLQEITFPDTFVAQVKIVSNHLLQLPAQVLAFWKNIVTDLTKLVRSSSGIDALLRFFEDSTAVLDLIAKAESVVRPIFASFSAITSFMSAGRIINSINYILNGSFYKDVIEGNALALVSSVSFLLRRAVVTINWLFTHRIIDVDIDKVFAQISNQIAIIPVFSSLPRVSPSQFLDGSLITALVPLAIEHGRKALEGEEVVYNSLECASLASDITLGFLRLASVDNPYLIGGLSLIASGTGVLAFFCDPSNTAVKDTFIAGKV